MADTGGYIEVEPGVKLLYHTIGHGPQTVVAPFSAADDFERLSEGHRLIFVDMRGRGGSDAPPESAVWTDYEVRDVEAVRCHFALDTMALIGWSYLGGTAAMYMMANPERLERLVLMASIAPRSEAPYVDEKARQAKAESRLRPEGLKHLEELRESGLDVRDPVAFCRQYKKVYLPQQMGRPEALAHKRTDWCVHPNEWPDNLEKHWQKHFPPESWKRDWRADLAAMRLKIPVLIVHGTEDLIPVEAAEDWAAALPNSRLLVIPEVGHFPHLEAPDVFFPAVEQFLRGEWPPEARSVR